LGKKTYGDCGEEKEILTTLRGVRGVQQVIDIQQYHRKTWFVYKYLKGGELFDHLQDGRFCPTIHETRSLILEIAHILLRCQDRRIAHLHVTPNNLIFDQQGRLHLVDFAKSQFLHNPWVNSLLVPLSGVYAAPEVRDRVLPTFSILSDAYSLGVLYDHITNHGIAEPFDQKLIQGLQMEHPAHRLSLPNLVRALYTGEVRDTFRLRRAHTH